ncbi:structural maintenance of chromosome 3 (chondroitin sulfate proteoglycan 6) [Nematocida major]|uniref:structural maintenance of chromosome 3 (chondroitin sulfate proteoglycan 6) n=1 Tax=Nematocida major TaxID=1912982 RepID=UPI002008476C|nr:structural maintenance of chromosome 3 (chondroitin sulfate proteoglycan 6) [Nematocida major]KAH9387072.1 structural maintenance of chromosome 3 (chondroitin sulfate proteoglycan 6) [Nematocida major]
MRIRRIALFNFKSFSEETVLENVSEHTNVLIGKNGAGKSSILSAIKFVIDAHQRIGPVERRIFVNENSKELKAHVEIEFENANKAFPAGETVVVRRSITQKSDEYCVDGRPVPRDEMVSLYETAGISKVMPYFVVEQGKIGELAQMNGPARMRLIRDLAGSAVYEKDKEEISRVLSESGSIEQRIEELVGTIEKRVEAIERDKLRALQRKEAEAAKETIVRELYKRELAKVRAKLEGLFTEEASHVEDTQDATEAALRMQLEEILSAIHALPAQGEAACRGEGAPRREDLDKLLAAKERERACLDVEISRLERLEESSKAIRPEINILRMRGKDAAEKKLRELKALRTHAGREQSIHEKEALLESKRSVCKRESEHAKKMKALEEEMKSAERAFLLTQKAFSLGAEILAEKGVVGYVYDLITMPKEILSAVSTAIPNLLATIVTETLEDAVRLVREHNIEQPVIALPGKDAAPRAGPAIPLMAFSQYISSSEKYAALVEKLFGRIYFVSDFETAKTASRVHRATVVAAAGEYFGSSGAITGGSDKSSYMFKAYLGTKAKYREALEEAAAIQEEKKKVMFEYEKASADAALCAPGYIEDAIFLLENEDFDVEVELLQKRTDLEKTSTHKIRLEIEECLRAEARAEAAAERARLEAQAKAVEDRLLKFVGSPEWAQQMAEKGRLEGKFRRIQKRILSLDVESRETVSVCGQEVSLQSAPKEELVRALSVLKKELAEAVSSSEASEQMLSDYNKTLDKLKELGHAKEKILEMQAHLEQKKEQVINITIFQVKSNFEYFFRKLTGGSACVSVRGAEALDISTAFSGEEMVQADELSGGQKAVVALCMILAVQRIYEAPFYLMDEFDANLDTQVLLNIVESRVFDGRQLFVCTFRGETLQMGERFFSVKESLVEPASLESAREDLCAFLP